MKLVDLLLVAVCCCCCPLGLAADGPTEKNKLNEVLRQLKRLKSNQGYNGKMLNSPPENIEDCCCLSALMCFHRNMRNHFSLNNREEIKLYNSLNNTLTRQGLDFCHSGNNATTCQDCNSQPKVDVKIFFNRLESLIQRGLARFS